MNDKDFQEFVVQQLVKLNDGQDKLSRDVARIEQAHGEKLSALFDGYKAITEKLDEHTQILNNHTATLAGHTTILADHTERLQRIENKIETHDIQIQVLDKTKSNKRSKAK